MASGSLQSEKAVRFGPFETNLLTGEVRKYGIRIRLGGQPTQILLALLETPGEIVTREELRRRLWPDNTFVEFENGLNNAVKKLRSALRDSADHPLYIETLPRIGYRLVAPIKNNVEPAMSGSSQVAEPPVPERATAVHSRRWALISLPLLGLVAYGFFSAPPAPSATARTERPLTEHFDGFGRIISDGVRVYFLERSGNHHVLVQTSTSGGSTSRVETPFPNTRIFDVSPDRSEFLIGSFDAPQPGLLLWIWPVQGGSPIRVGNVVADDASWAPNGQDILYARGQDIRTVRRDGADDRIFIHTAGRPYWIRFSPDNRKLIFSVDSPQSDSQTLWEASSDGSNPHIRFLGWSDAPAECCGDWTPDGKYLVFTSRHNGSANLWAIREKSFLLHWRRSVPIQLTQAAGVVGAGALTRNGTRVFVTDANEDYQSERYNPLSGTFTPLPAGRGALGISPSPDGLSAAIIRTDWTLWRSKMDGSAGVQLTAPPLRAAQPQWSPDGAKIAFEAHTIGKPVRAYIVNAEGGPVQEILKESGEQSVPAWSPDGSEIAVALNVDAPADSAGPRGIYLVNWKTRHETKLPGSEGLTSPMWSPNGIYFIAKTLDERSILLFDSQSRKWKSIAEGTAFSGLTWSRDSRYLYVQYVDAEGQPIYRLPAGSFKPERVVSFETLINDGAETCILQHGAADESLIIRLRRGGGHVYAFDLNLP